MDYVRYRSKRLSKYRPLTDYLQKLQRDHWQAEFRQIEDIIGGNLPKSARAHKAWWANDPNPNRHSSSWLSAGWYTEDLDIQGERVSFRRVKEGVARPPQPTRRKMKALRDVDVDQLKLHGNGEYLDLSLKMRWLVLGAIQLAEDLSLIFPAAPSEPGLYRLRLCAGKTVRQYIGETVNLQRRFQHYRKPGPTQATNIRINELLRAHLLTGGAAEIDVITSDLSLRVGNSSLEANLEQKAVRRLFENAAILAGGDEDIDSLNR